MGREPENSAKNRGSLFTNVAQHSIRVCVFSHIEEDRVSLKLGNAERDLYFFDDRLQQRADDLLTVFQLPLVGDHEDEYLPQIVRAARGAGLKGKEAEDIAHATFVTFSGESRHVRRPLGCPHLAFRNPVS
jgi:hypothetical protein